MKTVSCFAWGEAGEMSIEYGLFTALMAVVVITVLAAIGTNLTTKFNDLATRMTSACMIGVNVGTRPPRLLSLNRRARRAFTASAWARQIPCEAAGS